MAKISRNAPCPCGSGKKYKKCCLPRDERKPVEEQRPVEIQRKKLEEDEVLFETDLDVLSNRVVNLIRAGELDEAEKSARHLLEEFPEVADGFMRLAEVYKAKGDKPNAVEYFRKAAEFMQSRPGWYDQEFIQSLLDEASTLESALK
jgi:tetratricopeptide (TPR) repeat protein